MTAFVRQRSPSNSGSLFLSGPRLPFYRYQLIPAPHLIQLFCSVDTGVINPHAGLQGGGMAVSIFSSHVPYSFLPPLPAPPLPLPIPSFSPPSLLSLPLLFPFLTSLSSPSLSPSSLSPPPLPAPFLSLPSLLSFLPLKMGEEATIF